ncbi:alkylphosphonate ABC tranporter [Halalkalibacter wakoensis JCM 9140]|uniref:Alkylphosphonate ABC tranporter n=1 Tax=Halalkalibacter wakoensis JCM 9140 TaxID=1236970 RepID=W4Q3L5_9BACI|nr:alkylphosphonate ABC tranporter [Halalkalibacter wakoensis JCM 9140]
MSKPEIQGVVSSKAKLRMTIILVAIIGVYAYTSWATRSTPMDLIRGWGGFQRILTDLFPPNWLMLLKFGKS